MRSSEVFIFSKETVPAVFDLTDAKFIRKGEDVAVFPIDTSHAMVAETWRPEEFCVDGGFLHANTDRYYPVLRIGEYSESLKFTHISVGAKRDKTIELIEQEVQGVFFYDKPVVVV